MLYTLSPLSHNLGLGALITALAGGGELVVHDLPRGHSLVDRLEETGAAFLFGVPTHAIDLLAEMRDPRPAATRSGDAASAFPARRRRRRSCRRTDAARRDAAERLRHDRDLLASIHLARRPAEA